MKISIYRLKKSARKNFGEKRLFERKVMYGATLVIIRPSHRVERAVWWMGTDGRLSKGPPLLGFGEVLHPPPWAITARIWLGGVTEKVGPCVSPRVGAKQGD